MRCLGTWDCFFNVDKMVFARFLLLFCMCVNSFSKLVFIMFNSASTSISHAMMATHSDVAPLEMETWYINREFLMGTDKMLYNCINMN